MPQDDSSRSDINYVKEAAKLQYNWITLAGMAGGTREARRLVEQGGVTLNGEKLSDSDADVPVDWEIVELLS